MEFFKHYFSDVKFDGAAEVKVHCPFHSDSHPSASINTEKDVFHCWVCDVGYNEQQFVAKINDISLAEASVVIEKLKGVTTNWFVIEEANLWADSAFLKEVEKLGLSNQTIQDLHLGLTKDKKGNSYLGIPVFYNGAIMDVRSYNLLKHPGVPKLMAEEGAESGFVIPYDLWKKSNETTYILEGEKDMMIARELGLNAITLTGGAGASPNDYVTHAFEGRDVIICYDNDEAGRQGADKLYLNLRSVAKSVKYVNIGDIVKEDKEDFYDMVVKYKKDLIDFYGLEVHNFQGVEDKKVFTPIYKALKENILRRIIITQVTVSAEFQDSYAVPSFAKFEKTSETGSAAETMFAGETRSWYLHNHNLQQALELIEVSAKKEEVMARLKKFVSIPSKEPNIKVEVSDYRTVYKTKVIDKDGDGINISLDLYSFMQMVVGKQYEIEYKIYPHPTKQQKLVAIANKVNEIDAEENFIPNKELLSKFQSTKPIKEHLDDLYQSAKHYVAKHLSYDLWMMVDLTFNSVLEFDYQDRIRGALDTFILGDTQVGKSETSQKLVDLYNFGHFLSLKTSTPEGLIGGSNKVEGSYVNTIGAIPRQHKRLVVLEEFSGARPEFIKRMTDVRSSGQIRISRVAGELNVPCRLRMITISNPVNDDNGSPRHLNTFPNGVLPIMELVKSAEDVSRYDGFLLVQKPTERINPFSLKLKGDPIPKEAYNHKINWVYTRKPEHVIFADGSDSYIWEKADELNQLFESNFPLFTTTTPLKLARFSVAMASLLMSTDENYLKVIVTKDIVDEVVTYLKRIYDNEVFKLREYKEEYDSYTMLSKMEENEFQQLYNKHSTLFEFLSHQSTTSRKNLQVVSGLDGDLFGKVFNKLVKFKFIRLAGETVHPTPKYRLAMGIIAKNFTHDAADTLIGALEKGDEIDV